MRHRVRSRPLHPQRYRDRAREAFVEILGHAAAERRAAAIATLPVMEWRGQRLHRLRCHGDYGKGPHDMNVPEGLLWSLIDFRAFKCPFHLR